MTTPINKVLTNQTQTFSNEELANVSASLSAILGQGSGGTYTGDDQYISVTDNTISFMPEAAELLNSVNDKLDTDIYTAASATWEDVATAYKTYSGDYLSAVNTTGSISGNGDSSAIGLTTSAESALIIASTLGVPDTTNRVQQWVWQTSTTSHTATPSGWVDFDTVFDSAFDAKFFDSMDSFLEDTFVGTSGISAKWVETEPNVWEYQVGISTSGLTDNTQYAWTNSGWKPVQGGGGTTYTAGDGIDITNDVISFDGLEVDTSYSGTLPKLAGDGTTENPLSISAFSNSIESTLDSFSTALTNLASEISSLGSSITLKGEGTCSEIGNYMNQAQTGDAYIATDSNQVCGKTVNKGDMVVKTASSVSVLTTAPDLSVYAKLSELPTVVPGANIVVTPTIVDGHTQYMITSVGGGGGAGMAYQFTSNDGRFTWTQSADDPQSPTVMTETLNVNLPRFEAVTSMPDPPAANTYYFIYEV